MDDRPRRDGDLLADPRRDAFIAAAVLGVVAVMSVLVAVDVSSPPLVDALDHRWRALVEPPAGWAERLSHWLYVAGSGAVMVPLRVVVALWLLARRRWVDVMAWMGAWALADLLTQLMKPGLGRMRPDLSYTSSLPSGYAKSAAQVAVGLVLVLTAPWQSRAWAWTAAIAWVVAMSISRTILVEHHLSDVVAGSLLGVGCAVGVAALSQLTRDRRVARSTRLG